MTPGFLIDGGAVVTVDADMEKNRGCIQKIYI